MKLYLLIFSVLSLPFGMELVPSTGVAPGTPGDNSDKVGPVGIRVPARCPPPQQELAQAVLSQGPLPDGLDLESRIRRYERTLSGLQSLKCPASSTTLLVRLKSLTALRGNPNAAAALQGLGLNDTP
jgi:hypothetical protein